MKASSVVAGLVTRWADALGDVDGLAGRQPVVGPVEGDEGFTGHHHPVLGAVLVALVAEPLARIDGEALDLAVLVVGQDLNVPQGRRSTDGSPERVCRARSGSAGVRR